jgi:membrane-bound ClpP family serine protease
MKSARWHAEVRMRISGRRPGRAVPLAVLALAVDLVVAGQAPVPSRPVVLVATLENDIINPITARFLIRAIEYAEHRQAACLVIQLDTPGGLVDSTRDITKRILDSAIPVVVYVAPSGSRAASAGLFITLAAHVAAMAPGTNIGAAHPVRVGALPFSPAAFSRATDRRRGPARELDHTILASRGQGAQ